MDECELILLVSTISCAIAKCSSDDELSLLSAIFTQIGDTLATILAKRELNEKKSDNDNTSCEQNLDSSE